MGTTLILVGICVSVLMILMWFSGYGAGKSASCDFKVIHKRWYANQNRDPFKATTQVYRNGKLVPCDEITIHDETERVVIEVKGMRD